MCFIIIDWLKAVCALTVCTIPLFSVYASEDITLDYIGQQSFETGTRVSGTEVGGLSGIDYLGRDNVFVTISDDRSQINPARFYTLSLDLDRHAFRAAEFQSVEFIKQPNGKLFPKSGVMSPSMLDPESIRLSPEAKSYFWVSEGNSKARIDPFVREMSLRGEHIRSFEIPDKFRVKMHMKTGKNIGVRNNLSFESLSLSTDGKTLMVASEASLHQDGRKASLKQGSLIRFLELDLASGKAVGEFVYETAPITASSLPFGLFSVNGLVEILAISATRIITVERSFSVGVGNSIRLYVVDTKGASDVSGLPSLEGQSFTKISKTLLLDLAELGIALDNIEGLALGQKFADGSRSLVLISDNNFSDNQKTLILAFAIDGLED